MRTRRKLLLAVLLTIVAVASGCGKPPPKRDLRAEKQLVARDGIPALREELKRDTLARAKELDEAVDILVARTFAQDLDGSVAAYREVRRRERDLSPLARLLAPISSSGFGAYGTDKDDGAEGFRPLHEALFAKPPSFERALSRAKTAKRAVTALRAELELASWTSSQVGYALSDASYTFGARLDGSDAPDEATRLRDVQAEGGGLLRVLTAVRDALRERDPATADALDGDALLLSEMLQRLAGEGAFRDTARIVRATGSFGVHFRKAFAPTAEKPIPGPFIGSRGGEAVSVGTFPRLRFARDAAREQLGKELFESPVLSDNGHLACTSCHAPDQGFSRRGARPLGGTGLPTARKPMSLWNIGHEVAFFWDGRAGSLEDQLDAVLERDLLTTWPAVMIRLEKDQTLVASFQRVTKAPPTVASTKAALVAYQRSLVADDLPLDRYFRGDDAALSRERRRPASISTSARRAAVAATGSR